jgi:hypothetical protein
MLDWDLAHVAFEPVGFDWRIRESWLFNETLVGGGFNDEHRHHPARVIKFGGNRASLHKILSSNESSPLFWWRNRLVGLGLQNTHGFGCLMRGLLQPAEQVRVRFKNYAALLSSGVFSIGIHFREGDSAMYGGRNVSFNPDDKRFKIAQSLTRRYANFYHPVRWLVVSDSADFRRMCSEWADREHSSRFPFSRRNSVIVPSIIPSHLSPTERAKWGLNISVSLEDISESIVTSVGEWWLLSLCSVNVLDGWSGFAKTAAVYSLNPMVNWRYWNWSTGTGTGSGVISLDETPCWLSQRQVGL